MGKFIDLSGRKFSRLTVIEKVGKSKNGQSIWKCKCDCGNITKVMYSNLTREHIKSCGCFKKESYGKSSVKHNKSRTRLYSTYYKIKGRCYNRNNPAYKNYGGRGIKICDEWLNKENGFINFYNWAIENGYDESKTKKEQTLDRINNNGNYEPSNCRWATAKEQASNTRNNHIVDYYGEKYILTQLSELLDIKVTTLAWRLNNGWKQEELGLSTSYNKYRRKK